MRQAEIIVIDEYKYEIMPLPPMQALKILTRLSKLVGGPIGKALQGGNAGDLLDTDLEDALPMVGVILDILADKMDEDVVSGTVMELIGGVNIVEGPNTKPLKTVFEVHFQGDIFRLLKVVKATLEVNYKDFFGGLAVLKGKVLATADPQETA